MSETMTIERAKEITAACVRTSWSIIEGDSYVDLPECPLEDMLVANRLVRESNASEREAAKPNAEGKMSYSVQMTVDPRGIAAAYAFEHYQKDPRALLASLGFRLTDGSEDE